MTRETGRQQKRSLSPNPRKYRLTTCHDTACVQVDSAVVNCWCDIEEIQLKKMHNEWIDILESPNVNLDIIDAFGKRVYDKFGIHLYKRPDTWCDRIDWSQFDFSQLGHLIAQMGKFNKFLNDFLITVKVIRFLFQKAKELASEKTTNNA